MAQTAEMYARYVSYPQILDVLRMYAKDATQPGPELFRRIAMNIAISNNDDHARNHAAFWDGRYLELTPAYDLAPGQRSGDTFEQAMAFGRGNGGAKMSNFAALVRESETCGLSAAEGGILRLRRRTALTSQVGREAATACADRDLLCSSCCALVNSVIGLGCERERSRWRSVAVIVPLRLLRSRISR